MTRSNVEFPNVQPIVCSVNMLKLRPLRYVISVCVIIMTVACVFESCAPVLNGIESTYLVKERVRLGYRSVVIRELEGDWSAFDTTAYTPVYIFHVLDENGRLTHEWIGGYHCSPTRPAEHPVKATNALDMKDTLRALRRWQFGSGGAEGTSPARVRYWSVDSVSAGTLTEVHTTGYVRDEGVDAKRERQDKRVMADVREEARRYMYYEVKRFVLQRVSAL